MLITLDVMKDKNQPVPCGELADGAFECQPVNSPRQGRVGRAKASSGAFISSGFHGFIQRDQGQALSTQMHEHHVDCEPVQPGRKGRVAAKGGNFAVQLAAGDENGPPLPQRIRHWAERLASASLV